MTYTQKERLRMLDCLLVNYGSIGHAMLMDWFGVSSACATRDLSLYRDLAPANVYFDSVTKQWHRAASFRPVVEGDHPAVPVLRELRAAVNPIIDPTVTTLNVAGTLDMINAARKADAVLANIRSSATPEKPL